MTDSSLRRHAYIAEVTPGTTPATPVFKKMRVTGGGLTNNDSFVVSEEMRPDRNVPDAILVGRDYAGDFPFEFSYGGFFDDFLEFFLGASWASDVIKNGVTEKTFTYELTDTLTGGASFDFERFVRCMVNTMTLNVTARDKVTGSFGIMGTSGSKGVAIIAGATYTDAVNNPIMSGSSDVGALTIGGVAGPKIQSITFNGTNNLDIRAVVGSVESNGLKKGTFQFSGSLNAYFDTAALRDLQIANGYVDISLVLGVGASKKYTISLPKCKLTNAPKNNPGNNEDVMLNVEFTALYDATSLATVNITRVP